jgi:hypothetical protein
MNPLLIQVTGPQQPDGSYPGFAVRPAYAPGGAVAVVRGEPVRVARLPGLNSLNLLAAGFYWAAPAGQGADGVAVVAVP